MRENLNKRYPSLQENKDLDRVLDKTGKIILVSELSLLNQELGSSNQKSSAFGKMFKNARNHSMMRRFKSQMRSMVLAKIRDQKDGNFSVRSLRSRDESMLSGQNFDVRSE